MLLCLLLCMSNNECLCIRSYHEDSNECYFALLLCMNNNECCVSGPITRIVMSVTLFTTLHEIITSVVYQVLSRG